VCEEWSVSAGAGPELVRDAAAARPQDLGGEEMETERAESDPVSNASVENRR
jgi:hypothetical protein